jgi:phosphatidylserine decarboxylase
MPLAGSLRGAWHVPGRLFSVNAATCARVPALFARNERVICLFEGEFGPFAVVMVGALFVGSISTIWHGEVTPWRRAATGAAAAHEAANEGAAIDQLEPLPGSELWQPRGAELGRFNLGSTVVLVLSPGRVRWDAALVPGTTVRMGQALGAMVAPSASGASGASGALGAPGAPGALTHRR